MISIVIEGVADLTDRINDLQLEQVPFATALALTRTARHLKMAVYEEFRDKFHEPTPFILGGSGPQFMNSDNVGSMRVLKATKRNLYADVWLKDEKFAKQSVAADPLLRHHFFGGPRVPKGSEQYFRNIGFLNPDEFMVPGSGARLDRFGNMSRGQWSQIVSQLRLRRSVGYENRASQSRASLRNQAKAGRIFWSAGPGGVRKLVDKETGIVYGETAHGSGRWNNLPKGVWVRKGGDLQCLLLVVRTAPVYLRLFDLRQIGEQAVRRHFRREFRIALRQALRTAGKSGAATHAGRSADWIARAGD